MSILKTIIVCVAIGATIHVGAALGLIASQWSKDRSGDDSLDFSQVGHEPTEPAPLLDYVAPDGAGLGYRSYASTRDSTPLLMLIHGSGWHGLDFDPLARRMAEAGLADVVVPDLRGHGPSPERRGDVDYIGQFEDDLHALVDKLRKPGQPFVMGGHSSGGGLVIRYAGGVHCGDLDGAVLLAPYLTYDAPTMRPGAGGWAFPLTRRIIGLSMLNMIGVKALNHLTVLDLVFPDSVLEGPLGRTATPHYSYRLNESFAPRRPYENDVRALPPFVLIAGREDEAFLAERYEPTLSAMTDKGRYRLLDGVSHLALPDAPETFEAIKTYLTTLTQEARP